MCENCAMLDIHSHILPNIDDGSKSLDESIKILKGLLEMGFKNVVLTPHFYPGKYTPNLREIDTALDLLSKEVKKNGLTIGLYRGRECYLDYELLSAKDADSFPFIWKDKKYQLIELPQYSLPEAVSVYVNEIKKKEITPILAHAERYNQIIRDPEQIQVFKDMGFLIQIDLISFSSHSHPLLKKTSFKLMDMEAIDLMASDVHHSRQLTLIREGLEVVILKCGQARVRHYFELP